MARTLVLLLPLIVSCADASGGTLNATTDDSRSIIQIASASGRNDARIDGEIADYRVERVTTGEEQILLVTGRQAGEDQCKVIVYSRNGRRLVEYQPPMRTPFPASPDFAATRGEFRRERVCPEFDIVRPFRYDGRRFLAFAATGVFAPSVFVILEATARDRFEERFVYWSYGHVQRFVMDGAHLAITGLNNKLRTRGQYRLTTAIFRLADVTRRDRRVDSSSPLSGQGGLAQSPMLYYWSPSNDRGWNFGIRELSIEDGQVHVDVASGLRHVLDLVSGTTSVDPSKSYAREFLGRRRLDPQLPPLDDHLKALRADTWLWSLPPS